MAYTDDSHILPRFFFDAKEPRKELNLGQMKIKRRTPIRQENQIDKIKIRNQLANKITYFILMSKCIHTKMSFGIYEMIRGVGSVVIRSESARDAYGLTAATKPH